VINGTDKNITVPTNLQVGRVTCSSATIPGGCPNNGTNFRSVTGNDRRFTRHHDEPP
jgi:hypothetical protein